MKTVIEMAREAGLIPFYEVDEYPLERFAALVREDEREKQQEPLYFGLTPDHTWLSTTEAEYNKLKEKYRMKVYTTPPTASLAARQMRDAAVKVCLAGVGEEPDNCNCWYEAQDECAKSIAQLPVPSPSSEDCGKVQWRDLTDEEIKDVIRFTVEGVTVSEMVMFQHVTRAVIAKFKEKQL